MDLSKKIWLSLFARQRFHKFNDRLLRRGLVGLGVNDFGPRQERGERQLLEKLTHMLPRGGIVCDVGAHAGPYSLYLASKRPDLSIHAFEPNPATYAQLAANANGRFTAHKFALGDKEGEAVLRMSLTDGGAECSLMEESVQKLYRDEPRKTVSVRVKTLDNVMKDLGLERIDYLKIDAEGYDLMVLRGASAAIGADKFGIVQFEIHPMNVYSRTLMHDFYQALPRHRLHRIVQDGLVPLGNYNPATCELFGLQNIVALPENIRL